MQSKDIVTNFTVGTEPAIQTETGVAIDGPHTAAIILARVAATGVFYEYSTDDNL